MSDQRREARSAAQGRDGRKDHQRRTGNDPHGPTGRAGGVVRSVALERGVATVEEVKSAAQDRDYRAAVELASFALWLWKEGWRPWTK